MGESEMNEYDEEHLNNQLMNKLMSLTSPKNRRESQGSNQIK